LLEAAAAVYASAVVRLSAGLARRVFPAVERGAQTVSFGSGRPQFSLDFLVRPGSGRSQLPFKSFDLPTQPVKFSGEQADGHGCLLIGIQVFGYLEEVLV
jgi:hypothetical protein